MRAQAERYGAKPLLRTGAIERSYQQMADAVARAGGLLADAGIAPGDRVALMSANRAELLDLILGCAWIGAVAVPLNTALRGAALQHQLTHSGARLLVLESGLVPVLQAVTAPRALRRVWLLDATPGTAVPTAGNDGPDFEPMPGIASARPPADVTPASTAAILYTSGTTGPAKGADCPHGQFYWWGANVGDLLGIGPADVLYTCLPLFHVNALGAFFQALLGGATYHLGPRFSASALLRQLDESGATVTYLLGAMVSILGSRDPSARDTGHQVTRALAPSATAQQHAEWKSRFGIELVDCYGSTETNAVLGAPPGQQRPGWMGPVRPGFEVRAVDDQDNDLPPGVTGELVVRAAEPFAMFNGYFRNPGQTIGAWRNLWFHTGDLVERSDDGWFRFRDRLSDSIRRRGENISSYDVEAALAAHPGVRHVAAYALASELGEEEVAVAVVTEAPSVSPEDLVRWCEGRLAYFAVPRFIRFVDDLPRTESGKVRKSVLRDEGRPPCWDRESVGVRVSRRSQR